MSDEYKIGKCAYCGQVTALKNNVCAECEKKNPIKDLLQSFGMGDIYDNQKN